MAATAITNVIVPEVFTDYIQQRIAETNALIQSGVMAQDAILTAAANSGGQFVNVPYWNDLTGADEVLSDSSPLAVGAITASQDIAVKLFRGRAFGSNELAGAMAGADPMQAIGNLIAAYWVRAQQTVVINVLTGIFATTLSSTHVHDVTGGSTALGIDVILDAKQKLGDQADSLTTIIMHSAKYSALQKALMIDYIGVQNEIRFPTFLGYRVLIDDNCPLANGNYTTYLCAPGAIAYANFTYGLTSTETERAALAGEDRLITRQGWVIHPRGVKYNDSGANPTNATLATGSKWTKVYDTKNIRIVKILSK